MSNEQFGTAILSRRYLYKRCGDQRDSQPNTSIDEFFPNRRKTAVECYFSKGSVKPFPFAVNYSRVQTLQP
jgi:hypothetical protein